MKKKLLFGFLVLLILIQFTPNVLPPTSHSNENDLLENNRISPAVTSILKNSCYNCHSNNTVYPWYSHIAPVSFLVGYHVKEGREHLNFSEWAELSKLDKAEALDDLIEEVEEGEMPIKPYLIAHPGAKLTETEKTQLINWAEEFAEALFE